MRYLGIRTRSTERAMLVMTVLAAALALSGGAEPAWGLDPNFLDVPYEMEWDASGHANEAAEAFVHWDGDGEIPIDCAKCHSTEGYRDFLGDDGTAAGTVENVVPVGGGELNEISCSACHNGAATALDSVTFPSGVEVTDLGAEARCMLCHQGRESGASVDEAIADACYPGDDTISGELGFKNIHYFAAAATQYGGVTSGGYQYADKSYDGLFGHVPEVDNCLSCHNSHSLEVELDLCSSCHVNVVTEADLADIRFDGSDGDYDGDGDGSEGIAYEIVDLRDTLYSTIQAYAAGRPDANCIVYESHTYPYWFFDPNCNGEVDPGEANYGNRYQNWTPRLLKAAYNYQVATKDPGGYAHNGKYIIQLLYDSIEDLDANQVVDLLRGDIGHFDGSTEAFRHWDEDGAVPGSCSKCHSATGLPHYLEEGVNVTEPIANGLLCTTCHDEMPSFTRHVIDEVEFPSGLVNTFGTGSDDNLCASCHQGRESTISVNDRLADNGATNPDTVYPAIGFQNIHYYASAATVFGTKAKGAYEYVGNAYSGRLGHRAQWNSCTECHETHTLEVKVSYCAGCHDDSSGLKNIRNRPEDTLDYDGDGDGDEGLGEEIDEMHAILYDALQTYATNTVGTGIVYDSHTYPYFFVDTNGSGDVDPGEAIYPNRYNAWTPRLLKGAYNYQFVEKDPGGYAHNGKYVIQVLHDSLADMGADVSSMARPDITGSTPQCGDLGFPYPLGDFTQDCFVDGADFAVFAIHWLEDGNP